MKSAGAARAWCVAVLMVALALEAGAAAVPGKIYIITDLEGVSGVYQFSQTRETTTTAARQAREWYMGDLAAVVRGLRAGGATEIFILDGHGNQSTIPELMEPGAKYLTGKPRPGPVYGFDDTYAGVVFFGAHAMMGTPDGVLCHTQNSRAENRYWYHGVESGELAQGGAFAGHFGVPPILVTGDEATCREATKFFGPACVTVATKKGVAREAAILYPFEETRKALFEGAKKAMENIGNCKPYTIQEPIKARREQLVEGARKRKTVTKEMTIHDATQIFEF
ncbi:M55 family metallopeptidase [bacterium]|nr:M55 family metallopeptidase [bacterium]